MDEVIEAGLGLSVAGVVMNALGSLGSIGTGVLGVSGYGAILVPVGIILTGLGVYNTLKGKVTPPAA